MLKFTRAISRLTGWRRMAAAFIAGALCVFAFAPFFGWPILFFTFPVFVFLIDGALAQSVSESDTSRARGGISRWRHARAAAAIGWWFGFGYFATQLYWIGEAFLVEADRFAWLLPFAVTILPAGLALFWAAAAALATFAWLPGATRVLALVTALGMTEWLRGHVLTGFPWNVPGYALTYPLPLMQSAGLVGIYGLTLVALMIFIAPVVFWADALADGEGAKGAGRKAKLGAAAIAIVPLIIMAVFGAMKLMAPVSPPVAGVKLRIVQPSVPQDEKWLPEHQRRIFDLHLKLSKQSAKGEFDDLSHTTLLIWPEAAMPFRPLRAPFALSSIAALLPPGVHLLSGALRETDAKVEWPRSKRKISKRKIFNSVLVLDSEGMLVDHYDKTHLVPFGEFLPFQETLEAIGLEQLDRVRGGFDIGSTPRPSLTIPGLPLIGPLICYEVIFPGVGRRAAKRPALYVNLTNDGWFGTSIGPHQHLHQARVRAVEEGVPLIRAANNGISAIIDPRGRVLHRLGLNRVGVIDSVLPAALAVAPLYSRHGDIVFWIMWLFGIMALGRRLYRFGL